MLLLQTGEGVLSRTRWLPAMAQAFNERPWQIRGSHASLRLYDVVFDTPELDDAAFRVDDGVSRPGVAVARLTDAAGIGDEAAAFEG